MERGSRAGARTWAEAVDAADGDAFAGDALVGEEAAVGEEDSLQI